MVVKRHIRISTRGSNDIVDITDLVAHEVERSGVKEGIGCVMLPGSTGAITTIEYEPGVLNDLIRAIERLVPRNIPYEHDGVWGDGNGFSHVRSALLGTSFSFPISEGRPVLGTWQQIVFIECDNRPRNRKLILTIVGE